MDRRVDKSQKPSTNKKLTNIPDMSNDKNDTSKCVFDLNGRPDKEVSENVCGTCQRQGHFPEHTPLTDWHTAQRVGDAVQYGQDPIQGPFSLLFTTWSPPLYSPERLPSGKVCLGVFVSLFLMLPPQHTTA